MKKVLNIVKNIFVWAVVAVAIFVMIFTIVSVNTFDRNDRDIFGYKMFIVLSDSMKKTHFDAGDLIVVKNVDPSTLKEGDVITFLSQDTNDGSFNTHKTHMIKEIIYENGNLVGFQTYGTTTGALDETIVQTPYIRGKYQFHISKLGSFFNFLKTPQGYIVCILIPFMILILYQGLNCIRLFRRYKKEQIQEIEAERNQIEEERRASAEMMKELKELKAQLAAKSDQGPANDDQTDGSEESADNVESAVPNGEISDVENNVD